MNKVFFLILLIVSSSIYSEVSTLSIKDLKNRTFPKNIITVESEVGNYNKYSSYDISFNVNDAKEYALMSVPKSEKPIDGYPLLILIHGHIPPKQYSTFNSYKYMFNRYASSEFVVIKPDLRSHGRSGSGSSYDGNVAKLYFLEDMLQLLTSIESLDNIDTNNIFLMGHSNGGDTVARLLSVLPNKIKAASMWAPVTINLEESNFYYKGRGRKNYGLEAVTEPSAVDVIIKYKKELQDSLLKIGISEIESIRYYEYLKYIKTSIKIRHADTDIVVPYSWSKMFIQRAQNYGYLKNIQLVNYPGDDHNIAKNQSDAQKADLLWFRTFLNK
ncbi:MAG: prolyl oligopeptidase family serine peptidase [Spirochaetaceae bacterium]